MSNDYFNILIKIGQGFPDENGKYFRPEDNGILSVFFAYDGLLSFASCEKQLSSYTLFQAINLWVINAIKYNKGLEDILLKQFIQMISCQKDLNFYSKSHDKLIQARHELAAINDKQDPIEIISALNLRFNHIDYSTVNASEWEDSFKSYMAIYSNIQDLAKLYNVDISKADGKEPDHGQKSTNNTPSVRKYTFMEEFIIVSLRKFYHELYNALAHLFLVGNDSIPPQSIVEKSMSHLQRGVLDGVKLCLSMINELDDRKQSSAHKQIIGYDARLLELKKVSDSDKSNIVDSYVKDIKRMLNSHPRMQQHGSVQIRM